MPERHSTSNRLDENFILEGRTLADIKTALAYDIRRAAEEANRIAKDQLGVARLTLTVLRRIDKRLAKKIKLR